MKRNCHDTVSGVKCLLNSITMVNVNINVQNSLMVPNKINKKLYHEIYDWNTQIILQLSINMQYSKYLILELWSDSKVN